MRNRSTTRSSLGSDGQAAVESALAIPMSLFVVLGLLQMGMLQQARLMADYAAYRGTRTASVQRLDCDLMKQSEIAALVPMLGRADEKGAWKNTFKKYKNNLRSSLPVVVNHWAVENVRLPFDKPLAPSEDPERLRVHLRFYYQMNIPFANWIIAKYFLAMNGIRPWSKSVDPLMSTREVQFNGPAASDREAMQDYAIVKSYFNKGIFVAPIYASWTMRMFSQGNVNGATSGDCQ
jgi:hypothetical protein